MSWLGQLLSPMTRLTDEAAMRRVQADGDPEAFAELVRRWQGPVRALCVRMTGDERYGEDLAQETFVRAFAARGGFDAGRKFSTWLWRIALNLCHNERRRRLVRAEEPLGDDAEDGPFLRAFEPGPDERLMEQEQAALVRAALQGLPASHRAVVVLREYEGLKLREIAEVLDLPEGTVKSRLADALTQLARRLKPVLEEPTPTPARARPHPLP